MMFFGYVKVSYSRMLEKVNSRMKNVTSRDTMSTKVVIHGGAPSIAVVDLA